MESAFVPKPNNPNFSSGPCAKRPGWSVENFKRMLLVGRSHRASAECKKKLNGNNTSNLNQY